MLTVNEKRPWLVKIFTIHIGEGIILGFLVGIDQYVKYWCQMRDLVIMNPGGVLGLWPSLKWMGLWVLWGVLVWEWKQMERGVARVGMGLIMAGGLSNLLDRVLFGSVRDYIYYPIMGFYGNIADIFLLIGALLLVTQWIRTRNDRIAS